MSEKQAEEIINKDENKQGPRYRKGRGLLCTLFHHESLTEEKIFSLNIQVWEEADMKVLVEKVLEEEEMACSQTWKQKRNSLTKA